MIVEKAGNVPDDAGANSETASAFLRHWAQRKMQGFEGTIDAEGEYLSRIYPAANSISEQIAADYHGRFLIELIQNGHDVQAESRKDGRIEVLFDAGAGTYGTLYVANGGSPFREENVRALSELGLSSKQPGQAIGNKGLGFRSVRHVSDNPQIYSQALQHTVLGELPPSRFAGFCFRFATKADLSGLVVQPRNLELATRDLPPFHIPIWLEEQPARVLDFASRGFSTVIALPLRDAAAGETVVAEMEGLRGLDVPMLLFLTRLASLEIRTIEAGGIEVEPRRMIRSETALVGTPHDLIVADLGIEGKYLLARREIAEGAMLEAISAGVQQGQLHSHWKDWEGRGEVAVAVRLGDGAGHASRLFTFLPMGEQAHSPFSGHLHASFFPTANRKGLDGKVRLNAMLLEQAADLSAETVAWLTQPGLSELDVETRANAAIDLMSWRKVASFETLSDLGRRVGEAIASRLGVATLADAAVAPVIIAAGNGELQLGWRPLRLSRVWAGATESFSRSVAAMHGDAIGAWPLWPGLGQRLDLFLSFIKTQIPTFAEQPSGTERIRLAVLVAASLDRSADLAPATWAQFYKDLPEFVGASGGLLAETHILWCDDGVVRPTMPSAPLPEEVRQRGRRRSRVRGRVATFVPPARRGNDEDGAADLSPPKELSESFAFLSTRLDWYGDLADARGFLLKYKLILEFDRESILTQIARVMRGDERALTRGAGLRWAFQIWRGPQGKGRGISIPASLRFYVPTLSGYRPAEEVLFSAKWPDRTRGRLLQRFLDAAPGDSTDLREVGSRRLVDPDHYSFRIGNAELWTDFLIDLGVKCGLHPIRKQLSGGHWGSSLNGQSLWRQQGLSETAIGNWKKAVEAENPRALTGGSNYALSGEMQWMPGQWDIERFDRDAAEHFAVLVIAWLGERQPDVQQITIRHSAFHYADVRHWPTPLTWFLRDIAWLPAQEPGSGGTERSMAKPSQIWMASDTQERFPYFLRRPSLPVMRALEATTSAHMAEIRNRTGLRFLDDPDTLLPQAAFLAEQFSKPTFERYYDRQLANLYAGTWQRITDHFRGDSNPPAARAPEFILARRGSGYTALRLAGDGATQVPVYIRDGDDETAASLVEAADLPMMEIRAGDRQAFGKIVSSLYGDRVRLLSAANYAITVDDADVADGETRGSVAWCPRLPLMMSVAMEGMKGLEARMLPLNRQTILDRLERVVIRTGTRLGFKLDDVDQDDLGEFAEALCVRLDGGRTIVVVKTAGRQGWEQLDQALPALCQALDQPGLEQGLRILLRTLQATGAAMDAEIDLTSDLDTLCDSLRLGATARRFVRETMGGGLERHLPWLRAVVYLDAGHMGLDAFVAGEAEAVLDADRLKNAIERWTSPAGHPALTVLDACRSSLSVAELRQALSLDFEALNRALVEVGQRPDTYPDVHARQLSNWLKASSMEIVDSLRSVALPAINAGNPAPNYAAARDEALTLQPEKKWEMVWPELPDNVLKDYVNDWLVSKGAPAIGGTFPQLRPLDDVRRLNGQVAKDFASMAGPLVRAWCGAHSVPVPQFWLMPDADFGELRSALDRVGVFDIAALDLASTLTWAVKLGCWPNEMKKTLSRDDLELGDNAVQEARAMAEAAIAARRKEERSIEFNGKSYDPEETDWSSLEADLSSNLSADFLNTQIGTAASLMESPPGRGPASWGSSSGGWGSGGSPSTFAPRAKTEMIGRLGELAVRRWLQKRLPRQDIDAAWRSGNARTFTGRDGDDGLGFDFEVSVQRQIWQIEVKASLNDPRMFDMGETEVAAARRAARSRSGVRYWIAYVSNLADPKAARVEMIGNPLGEEGEAFVRLVGEGLRYMFKRS